MIGWATSAIQGGHNQSIKSISFAAMSVCQLNYKEHRGTTMWINFVEVLHTSSGD